MSGFTDKLAAFFLGRAKQRAPAPTTEPVIMMVTMIGCPFCDDDIGGCSACEVVDDSSTVRMATGTINPPIRED